MSRDPDQPLVLSVTFGEVCCDGEGLSHALIAMRASQGTAMTGAWARLSDCS